MVPWYKQLPQPASDTSKPNERAAAFIKKVGRRPGKRLKNLRERLEELEAEDHAAARVATWVPGGQVGQVGRESRVAT